MTKQEEEQAPLHIVVLPWLAFGHMIPLLELSKALAKRGHHISYLTSPRNIARLPKIFGAVSDRIDLVPLPLPSVPGLPDHAEATSDLSPDKVQYLKLAYDGLRQPFTDFLLKVKPDWVILDFASHWAAEAATELSIPCALFTVFNACFLSFMGPENELSLEGRTRKTPEDFTGPPAWIPFPSNIAYSLYGAKGLLGIYEDDCSGFSDTDRYAISLRACKAVAPRTCREVEAQCITLLEDLYKKPVIPVGLLAPEQTPQNTKLNGQHGELFDWLDKQAAKSVVYIAFGSEATLEVELLRQLALGLEQSGMPFLWALRKPHALPEDAEVLPEGFEERTRGRGVVTTSWIPQLEVLAHAAVGGFLTHSGWSSVIEAMQHGHPLILLPIFGDQDMNAGMVEARGFGVKVERQREDGFFDREAVARVVRAVIVEEEGKEVRRRAEELKEVFADRELQEGYVDEFIKFMKEHGKKNWC